MPRVSLPKPVQQMTDAELRSVWDANVREWLAETKAVHAPLRAEAAAILPTLQAAEEADPAIVAARVTKDVKSRAEDEAARRISQRMAAMRETLLAIPVSERRSAIDADPQVIALRAEHAVALDEMVAAVAAYEAACSLNAAVTQMRTRRSEIITACGRVVDDAEQVQSEMKRRGIRRSPGG